MFRDFARRFVSISRSIRKLLLRLPYEVDGGGELARCLPLPEESGGLTVACLDSERRIDKFLFPGARGPPG